MKYLYHYLIVILILLAGLSACSKVNEDIPTPPVVNIHGEGNLNPESDNFHGYKVADSQLEKKLTECQQCHGADYSGGITSQSCTDCHTGIQVHSGADYSVPDHFTYFYSNDKSFEDCWSCHGDDFSGGVASPSCETCHSVIKVHESGTSVLYHAEFLPTVTWNLDGCKMCHGDDYAGKENRLSPSCLTCHTNEGGPEACNTCHGQFGDPSRIAPPVGLNNKTDQNQYVGAHENHLYDAQLGAAVACGECHIVPDDFSDETHIDDGIRAEIVFGQIIAESAIEPSYNQTTLTCSNTYCHGGFEFKAADSQNSWAYEGESIKGNNFSPQWLVDDGSQKKCGTCHGEIDNDGNLVTPLPNGHAGGYDITACVNCHTGIVDNEGNIVDHTKHINGQINVFGN